MEVPSLRKYVTVKKNKNISELHRASLIWNKTFEKNGLSYEIDWLGVPVVQKSEDLILMQELIFNIQPDFIIETGVAHGGSLIFYASILELLKHGSVIGIDVDIRRHNRRVIEKHPLFNRITLIEDSSVSETTIDEVHKKVPKGSKVIICLDSNHTKGHVLKELDLYKKFVKPGCYIVVFDTWASRLAALGICDRMYNNNGPAEAVAAFLKKNPNYKIDKKYNKLYTSYTLGGFLKRIR